MVFATVRSSARQSTTSMQRCSILSRPTSATQVVSPSHSTATLTTLSLETVPSLVIRPASRATSRLHSRRGTRHVRTRHLIQPWRNQCSTTQFCSSLPTLITSSNYAKTSNRTAIPNQSSGRLMRRSSHSARWLTAKKTRNGAYGTSPATPRSLGRLRK